MVAHQNSPCLPPLWNIRTPCGTASQKAPPPPPRLTPHSDLWKNSRFPTWQSQHGGVILAVGHPRGIRYAVPPQVGVVVGGGQHNAPHLGEGPVLSGQGGAHQDPATQTGHKAANLHVHHHRPVLHGERSSLGSHRTDGEKTVSRVKWLTSVENCWLVSASSYLRDGFAL